MNFETPDSLLLFLIAVISLRKYSTCLSPRSSSNKAPYTGQLINCRKLTLTALKAASQTLGCLHCEVLEIFPCGVCRHQFLLIPSHGHGRKKTKQLCSLICAPMPFVPAPPSWSGYHTSAHLLILTVLLRFQSMCFGGQQTFSPFQSVRVQIILHAKCNIICLPRQLLRAFTLAPGQFLVQSLW